MRLTGRIIIGIVAALSVASCGLFGTEEKERDSYDRVLILYSAACNNISGSLSQDLIDVSKSCLPGKSAATAIVSVAHNISRPAAIVRMYEDKNGNSVMDTLRTYAEDVSLADPAVMREALSYVREQFDSEHYRMVFSSHASDWLPDSKWCFYPPKDVSSNGDKGIVTQSIGNEVVSGVTYEMTLDEFRNAIPMKMDAILFDACLMAGVEVAYELRDVCDYLGFSPAEVLADGFDYHRIADDLLQVDAADAVRDVCAHFFEQYENQPDYLRSATISAVRTSEMDALAECCRSLFERYREGLDRPSRVPQFFDGVYEKTGSQYNAAMDSVLVLHWCYDMQDIMSAAGISGASAAELQAALDRVVYFKKTTERRYSVGDPHYLPIEAYCGLTMYLPSLGSNVMTDYYRTLSWNKATVLVQ